MPYTDEQRGEDVFLLADINIPTITDAPATATIEKVIYVPRACTIERLWARYETEAGTTPALTVELRTGTTVLFSAAVTAAATSVSDTAVASGQSADRDFGEELNIAFTSANADNDFTKVSVQVWATRRTE